MSGRIYIFLLVAVTLLVGCNSGVSTAPAINLTAAPSTGENGESASAGDSAAEEVVAYVNGQPIYAETFNRELARFEAGQVSLGFQISDEAGYKQQILDMLIEQELTRQVAMAQGLVVSDAAVDNEILVIVEENGREYFDSWLQRNYYTEEEFRELLRLELLTQQLLEPVFSSVPETAEYVHARHILVRTDAEAQDILAQLQSGEDFASLASAYSIDTTTRPLGGDLGWFPRGVLLVKEVEDTAFALGIGEISGVVASAWGYHVVQTLEFESDRAIEPEARQRLVENALSNWRLQLRHNADIQQIISFAS